MLCDPANRFDAVVHSFECLLSKCPFLGVKAISLQPISVVPRRKHLDIAGSRGREAAAIDAGAGVEVERRANSGDGIAVSV